MQNGDNIVQNGNIVQDIEEIQREDPEERFLKPLRDGVRYLDNLMTNYSFRFPIIDVLNGRNLIEWTIRAFKQIYEMILAARRAGNNRFKRRFRFDELSNVPAFQYLRTINGYTINWYWWGLVSSVSQSAGRFNVVNTFDSDIHNIERARGGILIVFVDIMRP